MAKTHLDALQRWQALADWFDSPVGRLLREAEQSALGDALEPIFGSYMVQFSAQQAPLPKPPSIRHTLQIGPLGPAMQCDESAWPISPQAADAVLLHHALEFARNPHQLLREAALAVRPGGHLLIVALNPWSGWGASSLFSQSALGQARLLSAQRTQDWLKLLGFSVEKRTLGCYRPPLASLHWQAKLDWLDQLGERWHAPGGGFYLLVARKLTLGLRPPKPVLRNPLGQLLPAPAVKVSACTLDKPCKRSEQ